MTTDPDASRLRPKTPAMTASMSQPNRPRAAKLRPVMAHDESLAAEPVAECGGAELPSSTFTVAVAPTR